MYSNSIQKNVCRTLFYAISCFYCSFLNLQYCIPSCRSVKLFLIFGYYKWFFESVLIDSPMHVYTIISVRKFSGGNHFLKASVSRKLVPTYAPNQKCVWRPVFTLPCSLWVLCIFVSANLTSCFNLHPFVD